MSPRKVTDRLYQGGYIAADDAPDLLEADSAEKILAMHAYWADQFVMETHPAVTGEAGMQLIQGMMPK